MDYFELRSQKVHIKSGIIYESIDYDAQPLQVVTDEDIVLHAIILTARSRQSAPQQQPWAYVHSDGQQSPGIWLNETDYKVAEPRI